MAVTNKTVKQYVNTDFNQNQLIHPVIDNDSNKNNASGIAGQMYYDTAALCLYFHNGTEWKQIGVASSTTIPTTTTANKVLISTSTSGTVKWSDWSTAGFLKTDSNGVISIDTSTYLTSQTWREIKVDGTTKIANNVSTALNLVGGTGITLTESSGSVTISSSVEPMQFKGAATVTKSGSTYSVSVTDPASISNVKKGYTYKITSAPADDTNFKVGDTLIAEQNNPGSNPQSHWTLIPSGDEPSGTVTSVGLVSYLEELSISGSPVTSSGIIYISRSAGYDNPVYSFTYINSSAVTPSSGIATITFNNSTFNGVAPLNKMPNYSMATFEVYEKVTENSVDYWDKIECAIRTDDEDPSSTEAKFMFNTTTNIPAGSIKIVVSAPLMQNYV